MSETSGVPRQGAGLTAAKNTVQEGQRRKKDGDPDPAGTLATGR
jgi:hypothetical protein